VNKPRRLGRGLAALLGTDEEGVAASIGPAAPNIPRSEPENALPESQTADISHTDHSPGQPESADEPATKPEGILLLSVYEIDDNPFQPRREFSEPEIASLSESLKEHDMLQPILVRQVGARYQLISGERRLRAAVRAGWAQVPVQVRQADDRLVAELAIVENLQRKDLNAIEKALSFQRYLDNHDCTQEDLAKRIKIDRSTIANLVRLLELPEEVKRALGGGSITMGHARALLPLGDEDAQIAFARQIREEGMSVRETERQVQEKIDAEDSDPQKAADGAKKIAKRRTKSQQLASLEQELRVALGTKVDIRQTSRGRGKIVIHFNGNDEFDRLRNELTSAAHTPPQSQVG